MILKVNILISKCTTGVKDMYKLLGNCYRTKSYQQGAIILISVEVTTNTEVQLLN